MTILIFSSDCQSMKLALRLFFVQYRSPCATIQSLFEVHPVKEKEKKIIAELNLWLPTTRRPQITNFAPFLIFDHQ